MIKHDQIDIKIIDSREPFRSRDEAEAAQVAQTLRQDVLPLRQADYHNVLVRVLRDERGQPEALVAYLSRKDTYTAEVVRVSVDPEFTVLEILDHYDDSADG